MRRIRSRFVLGLVVAVVLGVLGSPPAWAAGPSFSIEAVTSFRAAQVDGGFSDGGYRVRNTGDAPLDLSDGVRVEGADFSLVATGGTCMLETPVVPPGEQCIVSIRFRPVAEGIREGLLVVTPAGGTAQEIPLSSFGAPYDGLQVEPASLSFATTATLYEEKNFELVNPSGRPTHIDPLQVAGPYTL